MRWPRLCGAPPAASDGEGDDDDDATSTASSHHDHRTPAGNPLPDPVHLTVLSTDAPLDDGDLAPHSSSSASIRWINPRGRLVLVGDVHGCRPALEALLSKIEFQRGRDNLILCGDAVTKGPDSLGVIELAMAVGALCVRGNHDDLALAAAGGGGSGGGGGGGGKGDGGEGRRGGRSPHSFAPPPPPRQPPPPDPDFIPGLADKHRQWLAGLPFTLRLPQYGAAAVHAGVVPGVARRSQSLSDVTRMRALVALPPPPPPPPSRRPGGGPGGRARRQGVRWRAVEAHEPGSVPWAGEWRGPGHVFFGHDAALGLQRRRGATGLDTGCVYAGGRLTAAVLPPLEELRRRRGGWRALVRRWRCCGGGGGSGTSDDDEEGRGAAALPRTPRFSRDLHGRIVSVPGWTPVVNM